MNKKTLFLSIFILFNIYTLLAQTGEVRGFVYDKENGEPIIFTNVFIQELMLGKATDINGFYALTKLKEGKYTLKCVALGYDTASVQITIVANKITTQNLYVKKIAIQLTETNIVADRQKEKNEVKISVNTITQKNLKQLPAFGGEPDLAQYLQVLPGVVFSGDQGGQLYIRGGTPVHNKMLLDGMIIYNPFHSIGLFSVIDADIIRSADVYAGSFGAQYGGRIGAIIDVNTREGNKKELSGKVSVSPISSKVLLEGPLAKFTEGGSSSSYILSYKSSYLDKTSPIFYSYAGNNGLPFSFNDIYGKASFISTSGSKLNVFAFNFNDKVNYTQTKYNWNSFGLGTSFNIIPEGSTLINGAVAYSNYLMQQDEADGKPRESSINGFNINVNFTYFIGKDDIKYGLEMNGFTTDYNYTNTYGRLLKQEEFTTELCGYVRYKKNFGRLVMEPGLRIQNYASLGEFSFEPRFGMKYNLTDKIRLKAAGGYYTQNLIAAVNDQDVVNLFYGFLSGPEDLPKTFKGSSINSSLQRSWHGGVGFELDLGRFSEINVEGYYKIFSQLTNINRNKKYDENEPNKPEYETKDYIVEQGNSYGADFRFKYEYKKVYIWAVYSLTFVNREAERYDFAGNMQIENYFPHFDRRHNVNLVFTYTFDKNKTWSFNTRWNYGSGFPFTKTQGYYEKVDASSGNPLTQNGTLSAYFTDLNTGRLPSFHRLDASLSKKMKLKKNQTLTITAAATNVYNRENIFYLNRSTLTRINQLPIMPTLGINYSF
ncbi:MAG: TonB-dependent receptor [Bacteroidia bacterium]|nr:TonB-dependent receptor [Bacteroidia bacterium]